MSSGTIVASATIEAEGIVFAYGESAALLEGIDLRVGGGEIVALLGASGCGKSTLLRVLAGLAPPRSGVVRFLGEARGEPHPAASLLFQQPSLLPWLRVEANVAFGLDFKRQPPLAADERRRRVATALAAVGLAADGRKWPSELSGGMGQRVALARALARRPRLVFADEPFSALDAVTRGEMQQLLVRVVREIGTAVLFVTHDLDEAVSIADRILLLDRGRLRREWVVDGGRVELRADIHRSLHSASRTLEEAP